MKLAAKYVFQLIAGLYENSRTGVQAIRNCKLIRTETSRKFPITRYSKYKKTLPENFHILHL